MKLSTSNPVKIEEFTSFFSGIEIVKGPDLAEVLGTKDEVITRKAESAGQGFIVEDTILEVNGVEIVDIKWKIESLKEGDSARWITSLGYNNNGTITVYRGIVDGVITKTRGTKGFAFDPYFVPIELIDALNNGEPATLSELKDLGLKSNYSARFRALDSVSTDDSIFTVALSSLEPWTGKYQNEEK